MLVPMRRHAGAVILLGGWLLMAAPFVDRRGHGRGYYDDTAPVARWTHGESFDTAVACEAKRRWCDDKPLAAGCPPGPLRCVPAEAVYRPQPTAPK